MKNGAQTIRNGLIISAILLACAGILGFLLAPTAQVAGSDYKIQRVEIVIPASTSSTTAVAPADFDAVDDTKTVALIAGVTQHAMGWTQQTGQDPNEISARVELINGSTLRATRDSAAVAQTDTIWVILIEYVGPPGGVNEIIVRDRRTHNWTGGNTVESYGPIASVSNTSDVVVFYAGSENPNVQIGRFNRGDVSAYIDGAKNIQLKRGSPQGAVKTSLQVVEFTGSNWNVQTGAAAPAAAPGGTDVAISSVGNVSNAWVYYTWDSTSSNLDERGFRAWLTSPTNLRLQKHASASATTNIRWNVISNPGMAVQTGAADGQFQNDLTATITGFTAVDDMSRSFAWVTGFTNLGNNSHPRDMWQFKLSDASTISLQRGRSGASLDYRYFVVSFPLGNHPLLKQVRYHWRNDNGLENAATSATGGVEDTSLADLAKGKIKRLRLEVSNEGNASSTVTFYRLEYGLKQTDCAAITVWTDVGAAGGDWDIADSSYLIDGDDTTDIPIAIGGVTNENITFKTPNAGVKDTSSQTAGITLSDTEFVELEYSVKATAAAVDGASYCFRVTDAGTPLPSYGLFAEASLVSQNDFKIQRGALQITGAGATITAGVDYEAPASLAKSFIRITNTAMTGAGDDAGGGNQNADDVTVYISNPENLLTSVTFSRAATAASDTHVDWEIIEYIGVAGGGNEITVRGQGYTVFGATATSSTSPVIAGVTSASDTVPFITGQMNPDTGRTDYNTGIATARFNSLTNQIDFTRGEAGNDAAAISWALVEFIGSNWKIQRAEHIYAAAGVAETENITPVNDLSRTFLHAQKRAGIGLAGLDDFGHVVWLSSTSTVSFELEGTAASPTDHVSVAYVIENTQTDGTPMVVTRTNGTQNGGPEPSEVAVNIGAALLNTDNASIFTTNRCSGTGTAFPRPMMGVFVTSTTEYRLWISDTGQTRTYRTEVVEWPVAPSAPPPPTGGGGGGFIDITPQNFSLTINNGDACTNSRQALLSLAADGAQLMMIGNDIDFTGSRWEPFGREREWLLTPGEGKKTVYVKFESSTGVVAGNATDTIDFVFDCAIEPPEPEEEEIIEEETGCIIECEKIDYEIFIINPDGSRQYMNGPLAKIEESGEGIKMIYFDDSGSDLDFDDIVIYVDGNDCEKMEIKVLERSAGWRHRIGIKIYYDGAARKEIILWEDSADAVGETQVLDIYDYPEICFESYAGVPIFEGIVAFEYPNYRGRSESFRVGTEIPDLAETYIGNDAIASIRFIGRAMAQLFEDANYTGASATIFENNPNFENFKISSIKIY